MSYTKNFVSLQLPLFIITTIIMLSTISCSKTPDVRLTMCQDLTGMLLNSPANLEWKADNPIMKGYQDLEMQVTYSVTQPDGGAVEEKASCFYAYEQLEPDMEEFNSPTVAYSTYPNRMIFRGKEVDKQQLADMVNQVMIKQGKEMVVKAKEGLKKVGEEVKKQLDK